LAKILRDDGLSEIEVQLGDMKLRLARQVTAPAPVQAQPHAPHATAAAAPPAPVAETGAHPGTVTSPMVGTIYLSPEEDAPTFVKEGDPVAEGQTIMIVEAMKTFNPIPAPHAGRVMRIYVADRQPVEFGEALAVIE
jgi:acetyl-CoA carboxylase biotin carboxyl carrier protein